MRARVAVGLLLTALCAVGVWVARRPADAPAPVELRAEKGEEGGAAEAPTLRGADAEPPTAGQLLAANETEQENGTPASPEGVRYVVRGQVRDRVTQRGLAEVEVRGSLGRDARVLRFTHPELRTTRTDADGRYELAFELEALPVELVFTALARGYQTPHAIPAELEGEVYMETTHLRVTEAGTVQLDLTLLAGIDIGGVVRDDDGAPIPGVEIVVTMETPSSTGYVELLQTDGDGRFRIHDVAPRNESGPESARAVISLTHPEHVSTAIEDAYALPRESLAELEVTMHRGLTLSGTVLRSDGSKAPGQLVETFRGDPNENRRCAWTDEDGQFALEGLAPGDLVLRVVSATDGSALRREQKVLRSDDALVLRLEPLALLHQAPRQHLLGVEFVALPPEVRQTLGYPDAYVLWILDLSDEAPEGLREHARAGDVLWSVGRSRVASLRDVVAAILESVDRYASYDEQAGRPPRDTYGVRIVIGIRRQFLEGTNTQGIRVTREEVESLRRWLTEHPEGD